MRTLFFDIDGTLLLTQQAGSGALCQAMRTEFGVEEVPAGRVRFGGRTDRDLVSEFLQVCDVPVTAENQGRLRRAYSHALRHSLVNAKGEVLPGVFSLLQALSIMPAISLAVMTGNFPETARMKLETFRLVDYFPWVVGGDLDAGRNDMAKRAAEQLRRRSGDAALKEMIVIGDTPNDVHCAHSIGAVCLGVCTGSASRRELEQAGAELVVDDLTDDQAFSFLVDEWRYGRTD